MRDLQEAQRLLDVAKAWTREVRLTFNIKKCAVVTLYQSQLLL